MPEGLGPVGIGMSVAAWAYEREPPGPVGGARGGGASSKLLAGPVGMARGPVGGASRSRGGDGSRLLGGDRAMGGGDRIATGGGDC